MKKKISYLLLLLPVIFSSCNTSVELVKRKYNSGYFKDWQKKDLLTAKLKVEITSYRDEIDKNKELIDSSEEILPNNEDLTLEASVSSESILPKKIIFNNTNQSIIEKTKGNTITSSKPLVKERMGILKKLNSKSRTLLKQSKEEDVSVVKVLSIFGIVIFLIIFLFINWILGALGVIAGILTFLLGGKKNNTPTNSNSSKYEDVVYLKNGGVVRGLIIEQIPNIQLKIQTRDRNVFVYKIDEVEKITKEPTN